MAHMSSLEQAYEEAVLHEAACMYGYRRRARMCARICPFIIPVTSACVSGRPHRDISCCLLVLALPSAWFVGFSLSWLLIFNVALAIAVTLVVTHVPACSRRCVRAPNDVTPRLTQRGASRLSPACFPCTELQLGTVLLSMLAMGVPEPESQQHVRLLLILTAVFYALTLATRLHTMTHMLHQLVGSVLLGGASIPALYACARFTFPTGVSRTANVLMTTAVAAAVVCYVSYKAEQDDFPLLHLSQEETDRVVRELVDYQLRAPPQVYGTAEEDGADDDFTSIAPRERASARRGRRARQSMYEQSTQQRLDDFE